MPHQLTNISFSSVCQDYVIDNAVQNDYLKEVYLEAYSTKEVSQFKCTYCN